MVKTKLKLKESLKNLKSTESANKAESSKKNKKAAAPVEQEELEEDNLASDTKKIISQINEETGSETLSHKEQRKLKKALKKQTSAADEDDEDAPELLDTNKLVESDSEDEEDFSSNKVESEDEEEEEEEEEEDVPLSDVELDDDADVVPFQKVTVNNRKALAQALSNITLPYEKMQFNEHLSVTSDEPLVLKDVFDDLERELGFYKQGLAAANLARANLVKENVPFTRPTDYFAEMVKSDEHMDKLKQKLVETETSKKAAQDARRQRELKKFGKQVQHAKLQERAKEKRETLDKIKSLKRKRSGNEISTDDFDIAVEEAAAETSERRGGNGKPNARRQAKNSKYGSGGKKRFLRKNDAASSNDLSGFNNSKKKGSAKRPGKSKRAKNF